MEGCPRNRETCPKLLDLIPQGRKWNHVENSNTDHEKKLELRLGPPGGGDEEEDHSAMKNKITETRNNTKNTYVPHISQKRTAPGPVVGWPPVRSLRKNLATTSTSKLGNQENQIEPKKEGMFVKVNMDGVPIGRKIDLNAYTSYEQLSCAVDKLFRGLLSAQMDGEVAANPIIGLLDGKGEFTLTYEDNEGDKMLVGDVPWPMFVSSVKRLRVIKSSDISSAMRYGCSERMRN